MSKSYSKSLSHIPAYSQRPDFLDSQSSAGSGSGIGGASSGNDPIVLTALVNLNLVAISDLYRGYSLVANLDNLPIDVRTRGGQFIGQVPSRDNVRVRLRENSMPNVVNVDPPQGLCEVAF